jgi:hypothetical protein
MGSMIRCKKCKRNLPSSEFLWGGRAPDGERVTECNACLSKEMRLLRCKVLAARERNPA